MRNCNTFLKIMRNSKFVFFSMLKRCLFLLENKQRVRNPITFYYNLIASLINSAPVLNMYVMFFSWLFIQNIFQCVLQYSYNPRGITGLCRSRITALQRLNLIKFTLRLRQQQAKLLKGKNHRNTLDNMPDRTR